MIALIGGKPAEFAGSGGAAARTWQPEQQRMPFRRQRSVVVNNDLAVYVDEMG
jgi:hypothetical protein